MGLLDWSPPAVAPKASEQSQQLARVEGRQGAAILAWCRARFAEGRPLFHLADLEAAVQGTPGSAGRVMRQLRAKGHLEVTNIDRASSLYNIERVA
jgi:hypothetical protein